MNFVQFLSILRARNRQALSIFAVVVASALIGSLLWPKSYTAVASVVVDAGKPDPLSAVLYSTAMNPSVMATQIDVIQSDRVAFKVVRNLKLTENPHVQNASTASTVAPPCESPHARPTRSPMPACTSGISTA